MYKNENGLLTSPQLALCEQHRVVVALSAKQVISLHKKSLQSKISFDTLQEVYMRGYAESLSEHVAFNRVNSFISGGAALDMDKDLLQENGLWDNIHAKRERIKKGSGEKMHKPGEKGAPTVANIKAAQEEYTGAEKVSKNSDDPASRFVGTTQLTNTYKATTPGYEKELSSVAKTIKKVVKEAVYQGREVSINKPMKGDVKKSKVFVKDPETGNVKKVNFGDKTLSIKKDIPARKRSYCARSAGQGSTTDKTKANYWSRRAWDC